MPEAVMYLYYDTILVEVIATTIEKSQLLQEVRLYWKLLQCVPISRCISNLFESGVVLSPTSVGIRLCILRLQELLAVEVSDLLVGNPQRLLMQSLLLSFRRFLLLLNLHVSPLCQRLDGFNERLVLHLFYKVYGIATFATAEALESAGLWRNIERRRLLVVERTAADIARATLP